jgi:hypothetical protein
MAAKLLVARNSMGVILSDEALLLWLDMCGDSPVLNRSPDLFFVADM